MEVQHLCHGSTNMFHSFVMVTIPCKCSKMSIRPTSNDVLLGRGGNNYAHEGNERLREIALGRAREYGASTKSIKGIISGQVLQQVQETGARFLKKIDYKADIWVEVDNEVAREKVCQVLRDQVSAIRCNDSLGSDRSSSRSSEGIKAEEEEEEEDNSGGTDEICHIRGGGEVEGQSSGPAKVKVEAEGFFASDDEMATDDSPLKYFVTSSAVLPVVNFGISYSFASHSGDFDLFEGELLRSYACDEIFVTPSKESDMQG
ncbi:hypothetical protein ACHAWT_001449 [Skeletonema menzelii]